MKKWITDPEHSELAFSARHLSLVHTTGKITAFAVQLHTGTENRRQWEFRLDAETASLNTLHKLRDERIKSSDFLHTDRYPKMQFHSTELKQKNTENEFELNGQLTLKGITKAVCLHAVYKGKAIDPYSGEEKMGWCVSGELDRREWGIDFNLPFKGDGVAIGNYLKIKAELEFKLLD